MGWFAKTRSKRMGMPNMVGGMPTGVPTKPDIVQGIKNRYENHDYNTNLEQLVTNINKLKEYINRDDITLKPLRSQLFDILLQKDKNDVDTVFKKMGLKSLPIELNERREKLAEAQRTLERVKEEKIERIHTHAKEFITNLNTVIEHARLADTPEKKGIVTHEATQLLSNINILIENAKRLDDNDILINLINIVNGLKTLVVSIQPVRPLELAALSGEAAKPAGEAATPAGEAATPAGEAATPAGEAATPAGEENGNNTGEFLAGILAEDTDNISAAAFVEALQPKKYIKRYHDCMENKDFLFDPCTGEGLTKTQSSLRKIRSRIFEIQESMKKSIPGSEYKYKISGKDEFLNNLTTNDIFLEYVFLNKNNILDKMLYIRLAKGNYPGADIYEVLCRLFVFFGGIDYSLNNAQYRVNPRTGGEYKFMNKFEDILNNPSKVYSSSINALKGETCKATNDSGASDVTLSYQSKKAPNGKKQMYIGSVKWLEPEGAPDKSYDIIKLNNQAIKPDLGGKVGLTRDDVGLLLFVKDKIAFDKKCKDNQLQYCNMCRPPMGHTFGSKNVIQYLNQIRNHIFEKANCEGILPYEAFLKEYDI